jgi:hypothetical protein
MISLYKKYNLKEYHRIYREKNRDKYNNYHKIYWKNYYNNNILEARKKRKIYMRTYRHRKKNNLVHVKKEIVKKEIVKKEIVIENKPTILFFN